MREILFRGKQKDNGEWVYGGIVQGVVHELWQNAGRAYILVFPEFLSSVKLVEVDPDTVGQFTGLTDRNAKRIFEGDIVEHHVQGNILVNRGVVNWDARNGRWAHQLNTMNPCFYMHNTEAVEVIGNIHDNPELLEVDE